MRERVWTVAARARLLRHRSLHVRATLGVTIISRVVHRRDEQQADPTLGEPGRGSNLIAPTPVAGPIGPILGSFLAENAAGIQGRRTTCGEVGREHTDGEHAGRRQDERWRVGGRDAEQEARQKTRHEQR
jgi:hypothetical protein